MSFLFETVFVVSIFVSELALPAPLPQPTSDTAKTAVNANAMSFYINHPPKC